jgi:hypothetical protein
MRSTNIIHYEDIHCKVKFRYKSWLQDDVEIGDIIDIEREKHYCYGIDQYIKNFIGLMKDRVIRYLPCLHKVEFNLAILDKNNMWHRFMIATVDMLRRILKIERKIDYYKSIFVVIRYENNVVFTGILNFQGLV